MPALKESGAGVTTKQTYDFSTMEWTIHLCVSIPHNDDEGFHKGVVFSEPKIDFPSDFLVTQLALIL